VSNGLTEYDLANVFYHAYLLNYGCFFISYVVPILYVSIRPWMWS